VGGHQVRRALSALAAVKANLLGVVLDAVKNDARKGGYAGYYAHADGGKRGRR